MKKTTLIAFLKLSIITPAAFAKDEIDKTFCFDTVCIGEPAAKYLKDRKSIKNTSIPQLKELENVKRPICTSFNIQPVTTLSPSGFEIHMAFYPVANMPAGEDVVVKSLIINSKEPYTDADLLKIATAIKEKHGMKEMPHRPGQILLQKKTGRYVYIYDSWRRIGILGDTQTKIQLSVGELFNLTDELGSQPACGQRKMPKL